ncbi:MAG TPA: signal peptide peptidase SppA, partial [Spirochaetales bacterium]|nr:signal peptide peptidase SppA [Spirochaetales bacterium]
IGMEAQPVRYVSLGAYGAYSTDNTSNFWKAVFDAGIRPFGTNIFTVFGRFSLDNNSATNWSAGASVRPIPGFEFFGNYASTNTITLGLTLRSTTDSISTSATIDPGFSTLSNVFAAYTIENSPKNDRIILAKNTTWVEVNLKNTLVQTSFIGKTYAPVLQVLKALENMRVNPEVTGIVLNLSGFQATRSVIYEIRKSLAEFKKAGKKIIAFIDSVNTDVYALACIADYIVIDPYAQLSLEGYYMGRLYLKHALEKLGIGVTEIKLFTHKTAAEQFTRSSMSDSDKEQYLAYLNTIYKDTVLAIAEGRKFSEEEINTLIEQEFIFTAQRAQSLGLVDAIGRYDAIKKIITDKLGGTQNILVYGDTLSSLLKLSVSFDDYYTTSYQFTDTWGTVKKIAVIYLDGGTELDSGMNARLAYKLILDAALNADAIVLRVNSPGGDPVASDYIAQAIAFAKTKVPVIVSMSDVAASGGYWVSMNADKIFATPQTITGSIGVIYSWLYDNGLYDKLGLSIDGVKKGSHADAYAGIFIPQRNLTEEEIEKAKEYIKDLYAEFVRKVAEGRHMDPAKVEQLAQGRIYSGEDARTVGLVDELGSLIDAINYAKEAIGLSSTEYVYVDEYFPDVPFMFFPEGIAAQAARLITNYFMPARTSFDAVGALNELAHNKIKTNGQARLEIALDDWEILFDNVYQIK